MGAFHQSTPYYERRKVPNPQNAVCPLGPSTYPVRALSAYIPPDPDPAPFPEANMEKLGGGDHGRNLGGCVCPPQDAQFSMSGSWR